jgi:hypothetical protein
MRERRQRCVACGGAMVAEACPRCALSRAAGAALRRGAGAVARRRPDGRIGALARKAHDLLEHEGLAAALRREVRKRVRREPDEVARRVAGWLPPRGPAPIVVLPSVDWDITLFQRPQQLARALAAEGRPVVYWLPNQIAGPRGVMEVAERVLLVDDLPAIAALLGRRDDGGAAALMVSSTAGEEPTLERVRALASRARLVYDFIDEAHEDVYAISEATRARHAALLVEADLVAVTADRLAEQVRAVRPAGRPVLDSPNAADVAHFARPSTRWARPLPRALRRLGDRPVAGYYGALARWVDWELLDALAAARPELVIVLIGADYDGALAASGLVARRPNVLALGPRRYVELPAYLHRFDVAMVPFVKSELTDATSPIKLFEYLAAEKPVVTTDLRECRKIAAVRAASSTEEFVRLVDDALVHREDPAERAARRAAADAHGWQRRARELAAAIDALPVRS